MVNKALQGLLFGTVHWGNTAGSILLHNHSRFRTDKIVPVLIDIHLNVCELSLRISITQRYGKAN